MNFKSKLVWKITAITLCAALIAFAIPMFTSGFFADNDKPVIIVLDPGHGGADTGAVNYIDGLYESDVNLDIALACRDELMRYSGVEVYMTHTGLDRGETMSLADRVDYVHEVGGDILISLHCNDAENPEAHGAEVYVSLSTHYDRYNQDCTQLALGMLTQFKQLGLTIRGVKTRMSETGDRIYHYDDGTQEVGDYYYVIASTIEKYSIPGMLVEHAFITGDAGILGNAEGRWALGVADATAIAQFYGLKLKDKADQLPYEEQGEVVLVTDKEILSASDVNNSLIKLPENIDISYMERLQEIRHDYELLTPGAKTMVDEEMSDRLYKTILQLDCEKYPVRLAASEDSGIVINRLDHTVTGLDFVSSGLMGTNVSMLRSFLEIYVDSVFLPDGFNTADCRIVVVDRYYHTMDIGTQVGTGTIVQLWSGESLLDEVTAVIMGDINGDGSINSYDLLLLEKYVSGDLPVDDGSGIDAVVDEDGNVIEPLCPAALFAGDVNGDSRIDHADCDRLTEIILEIS